MVADMELNVFVESLIVRLSADILLCAIWSSYVLNQNERAQLIHAKWHVLYRLESSLAPVSRQLIAN